MAPAEDYNAVALRGGGRTLNLNGWSRAAESEKHAPNLESGWRDRQGGAAILSDSPVRLLADMTGGRALGRFSRLAAGRQVHKRDLRKVRSDSRAQSQVVSLEPLEALCHSSPFPRAQTGCA